MKVCHYLPGDMGGWGGSENCHFCGDILFEQLQEQPSPSKHFRWRAFEQFLTVFSRKLLLQGSPSEIFPRDLTTHVGVLQKQPFADVLQNKRTQKFRNIPQNTCVGVSF